LIVNSGNIPALFKKKIFFVRCIFCIPLLFFWTYRLQAQPMSFIRYTTSDGLNDNHISGISRDSRGFYWISSQGGLNRFDGKFFKPFFPVDLGGDNRLTDNVKVFFENRAGHMAVTIGNGQLFELDCIFPQLIRVDNFKNRIVMDVFRANSYGLFIGCVDTVFITDNNFRIFFIEPLGFFKIEFGSGFGYFFQ
jgi:hypothetical protein